MTLKRQSFTSNSKIDPIFHPKKINLKINHVFPTSKDGQAKKFPTIFKIIEITVN